MERCAVVKSDRILLHNGSLTFPAMAQGVGPVVLLLHGFPDSPASFTHQLSALAACGYRAVAPIMRGYTPDAQPLNADYHGVRLAEDVVAWASELSDKPVHLVGHDWGANVAYAAAALAPERFATLTTIAVPHPVRFAEAYNTDTHQQARSSYILDFQAPGFEEQIIADDCAYLEVLWRSWSPGWNIQPAIMAEMKETFRRSGVAHAALEYYRQALDTTSPAGQETAALFMRPINVPTLGICGDNDQCISADIFAGAMHEGDFPGGLRVERVSGGGHFCHAEVPDAVNALLLNWLAVHQK
jgi:pimeloyl-ACP methyl ester carboxylesterase